MFLLKGNDSKDKFTFIWTLFSTFVSCNLLCWLYIFLIILCWNVYLNPRPKRKTTPTLSIHQWNLNSICAHNFEQLSVLKVYMSAHKIDIICLSETYLDFSIDEKGLEISGNYLIRSDHPSNKKRGGFVFTIKTFFP